MSAGKRESASGNQKLCLVVACIPVLGEDMLWLTEWQILLSKPPSGWLVPT